MLRDVEEEEVKPNEALFRLRQHPIENDSESPNYYSAPSKIIFQVALTLPFHARDAIASSNVLYVAIRKPSFLA